MVRPGVVPDAVVHCLVRVAGPLGAELPYRPAVAVAGVEEGHQPVEGVAVGSLGVGLGGAGAGTFDERGLVFCFFSDGKQEKKGLLETGGSLTWL